MNHIEQQIDQIHALAKNLYPDDKTGRKQQTIVLLEQRLREIWFRHYPLLRLPVLDVMKP